MSAADDAQEMTPAETAWVNFMFDNADTCNLDRLSFLAGYRQALLDAADEWDGANSRDWTVHPFQIVADWLRDRAGEGTDA